MGIKAGADRKKAEKVLDHFGNSSILNDSETESPVFFNSQLLSSFLFLAIGTPALILWHLTLKLKQELRPHFSKTSTLRVTCFSKANTPSSFVLMG